MDRYVCVMASWLSMMLVVLAVAAPKGAAGQQMPEAQVLPENTEDKSLLPLEPQERAMAESLAPVAMTGAAGATTLSRHEVLLVLVENRGVRPQRYELFRCGRR